MARKKSAKKKIDVEIDNKNLDTSVGPRIQGELLWKYRAVDAELRNVELYRKHVEAEIDVVIAMNGDLKLQKLWALLKQSKQDHVSKEQALKSVHGEIEQQLNISLRNAAINDETGEVFMLDTNPKVMDNMVETDKSDKN